MGSTPRTGACGEPAFSVPDRRRCRTSPGRVATDESMFSEMRKICDELPRILQRVRGRLAGCGRQVWAFFARTLGFSRELSPPIRHHARTCGSPRPASRWASNIR
jgi:hypothetical protein